jgi:hypothetical protein
MILVQLESYPYSNVMTQKKGLITVNNCLLPMVLYTGTTSQYSCLQWRVLLEA